MSAKILQVPKKTPLQSIDRVIDFRIKTLIKERPEKRQRNLSDVAVGADTVVASSSQCSSQQIRRHRSPTKLADLARRPSSPI